MNRQTPHQMPPSMLAHSGAPQFANGRGMPHVATSHPGYPCQGYGQQAPLMQPGPYAADIAGRQASSIQQGSYAIGCAGQQAMPTQQGSYGAGFAGQQASSIQQSSYTASFASQQAPPMRQGDYAVGSTGLQALPIQPANAAGLVGHSLHAGLQGHQQPDFAAIATPHKREAAAAGFASHAFKAGDWVRLRGIASIPEYEGKVFRVDIPDTGDGRLVCTYDGPDNRLNFALSSMELASAPPGAHELASAEVVSTNNLADFGSEGPSGVCPGDRVRVRATLAAHSGKVAIVQHFEAETGNVIIQFEQVERGVAKLNTTPAHLETLDGRALAQLPAPPPPMGFQPMCTRPDTMLPMAVQAAAPATMPSCNGTVPESAPLAHVPIVRGSVPVMPSGQFTGADGHLYVVEGPEVPMAPPSAQFTGTDDPCGFRPGDWVRVRGSLAVYSGKVAVIEGFEADTGNAIIRFEDPGRPGARCAKVNTHARHLESIDTPLELGTNSPAA